MSRRWLSMTRQDECSCVADGPLPIQSIQYQLLYRLCHLATRVERCKSMASERRPRKRREQGLASENLLESKRLCRSEISDQQTPYIVVHVKRAHGL